MVEYYFAVREVFSTTSTGGRMYSLRRDYFVNPIRTMTPKLI